MSNTIMTTIYNHYMTTYSPKKSDVRLDSHNKSELKNICSKIMKLNKEAPLYLYDRSEQTTSFALSLKENTRQLQRTILNTAGSKENDLFKNKVAFSTDDNVVSVKYIGDNDSAYQEQDSYEVEVQNLASSQINVGYSLPNQEKSLKPGTYSFDVSYNNMAYEFQFTVNEEDTNIDVQNKLARLFNHANIGLNATVREDSADSSSLRIESAQTGDGNPPGTPLFHIYNSSNNGNVDVVDFLGIDYVAQNASNAHFTINGQEHSTASNQFVLDKAFELTIKGVSSDSGEPAVIGLKTNVDSLKDNIYNLIGGYNTFLQATEQYKALTSSNKLSFETKSVAKLFCNELDAIGINITENGSLSVDDNLLTQTAESEEAYDLLSPLKDFSSSLFSKGEEISRDPLNYANQKIVAYKNPGKSFASPYATSNYSGLLFNYYC
ncbi:MAG: flagellar capping protein [Lachnospiraceae bacterium]|nr:flagellar capping protein [Lachnospiraceae bacterium]